MIRSAVLVLLLSPLVAGTALQTACTGTDRVYNGTSCYVLHKNTSVYSKAKIACDDYLGYSGHLIFIRDNATKAALQQLMTTNAITTVFTGYEQTNTSGARNASWMYAYNDGTYATATYIPWGRNGGSLEPTGGTLNTRLAFLISENGTKDVVGESSNYAFVCQYEESLMQTVTTMETACSAIKNKLSLYANGNCYTISTSPKNYGAAKLSCNDISGINGHLIQPLNPADLNIVQNFLLAQSGTTNSYGWMGIEQTNISAPNNASWYFTSPQGTDGPATYLRWWGSYPNGGTSNNQACYYTAGSGYLDLNHAQTYPYAICEYDSTRTITIDLNAQCAAFNTSYYRAYTSDGYCYIMHPETKAFNNAQLSCQEFLGYDGHLVHLRNASQQIIINNLIYAAGVSSVWIGLEQINLTEADSATNWYYVTPASNSEKATYLPWHSFTGGSTNNNAYYAPSYGDKIIAAQSTTAYSFICQYEQSSQRTITSLETYCHGVLNSFGWNAGWYSNGTCIANNGGGIGSNRNGCPTVTGLASHLVHLNSQSKWVTARTLGRQACEKSSKNVISNTGCYSQYTGFEQLKACTANTCNEEPNMAWFWTTPEGYKWAADVYSTNVWDPSFVRDTAGTMTYAWMQDAGYHDDPGTAGRGDFCEYHEPYNFTPFQSACLMSSNPSTFINSTCYTLNRVSLNFATAATSCTEFFGGHLAFVTDSNVATSLRANLWANFGLPPNYNLYTGMQKQSDNQWYYMFADGTNQSASSPPWAASQPSTADCNTNSVWSQWSTCSKTCDMGVRNRQRQTYSVSGICNVTGPPTTNFQYESCSSGTPCRPASGRTTALQSSCASLSGFYYGYSTCYFVLNVSSSQSPASTSCQGQGGELASLFGPDLVAQLGSVFLNQVSTIQAWVGLQYTGSNFEWIISGTQYTLFDNTTTPPPGQSCFALISNEISNGTASELPKLVSMDCAGTLAQAICMKSVHIYSSYVINPGTMVTESLSPESASIEYDANDCGSRCSEIISCLGFNYNPSDGSCIPTKVSLRTPTFINGNQVSTITTNSAWTFYDRT